MLPFSPKRSRLAASLLFAPCVLALVSGARAQNAPAQNQDEEEVVRISSDIVQTDVMVFDRNGKFVDGLKPEQFELKVDGKPQQIAFFDRVQAGTVNEDAQLAAARGAGSRPGGGVALPLDRGRTVIFFVDDMHLSATSAANIRAALQHFIDDEIGQNDVAAVVSASGQIGFLQQFTDNKAVMRAAVARINTRGFTVRDGQTPQMSEVQALAAERNDLSVMDYFVDALLRDNPMLSRASAEQMVEARARAMLQQSEGLATNTLSSLYSVMRFSSPIPGRKILFFISDGFVIDDVRGGLRDRMRLVADAAARAGVVIYSLDAAGMRSGQADAASAGNFDPGGRLSLANTGESSEMQSPLFTLAGETGGRALTNTNALVHSVSSALKETALYYLLAWKPAQAGGGAKYQRIEVSVRDRPDLKVIVRAGFYGVGGPAADLTTKENSKGKKQQQQSASAKADGATPDNQVSAAGRDLLAAMRAALPRTALPTTLSLGYVLQPQTGEAVLTTLVEIDRSALTFAGGERPRADLDLLCAVLDDHGKTVSNYANSLTVTLNSSAASSPQENVIVSVQSKLPPGLYQVRAAARDSRNGRTGSATQWVEIPEAKKGQLILSSIFLGSHATSAGGAAPAQGEAQPLVSVNAGHHFARSSSIRFLTYIYNAALPSSSPDLAMQVQIFRDNQPVFTAPLKKVNTEGLKDTTHIPYMAELPLQTFPAGRYVLQLTAIDRASKSAASQRANFIIE
jgi:VWFA-related protein